MSVLQRALVPDPEHFACRRVLDPNFLEAGGQYTKGALFRPCRLDALNWTYIPKTVEPPSKAKPEAGAGFELIAFGALDLLKGSPLSIGGYGLGDRQCLSWQSDRLGTCRTYMTDLGRAVDAR
jgi:hypothetical protein